MLTDEILNTIHAGDCIQGMQELDAGTIDLAFADPPFNIGYEYDVYNDKLGREKYLDWSREWISQVHRVLKPSGTFWLAIGDEYAAELKLISQEIGFHTRSWVVWYYTFGVNCKAKFTRSHAHLFYFIKDPDNFTFRSDDLENRIPSARELVYNDKRANPKGRLPDDTWIIRPADVVGEIIAEDGTWTPSAIDPQPDNDRTYTLRPQDIENCFQADEDTWYFPRVAGTFKERQGFHGCQMPEQLLGRIIRNCSEEGETVLDPFSGSATTLAVAKKLDRQFVGFELSNDYVEYGRGRLNSIHVGDLLDGAEEPTKSAPKTNPFNGKKQKPRSKFNWKASYYPKKELARTIAGVIQAFENSHDGYSADRVVADPSLNERFCNECSDLGIAGDARFWNILLFRQRKQGTLKNIPTTKRTSFAWEDCDPYLFACEIAHQQLLDLKMADSLDDILCDPSKAQQFDEIAARWAPGKSPLEYRWGALRIRKESKNAFVRAGKLKKEFKKYRKVFEDKQLIPIDQFDYHTLNHSASLYLISNEQSEILYAGETLDLRRRIRTKSSSKAKKQWQNLSEEVFVRTVEIDLKKSGMLAWQSCFAQEYEPRLNLGALWQYDAAS